uniref:Uncharacterized protein n=1 Tax=Amphimedon queenslandica TaxID=400682 RepID=A0A1X7U0R3_AMPQE
FTVQTNRTIDTWSYYKNKCSIK